jgi:hypothetical protein
MATHKVKKTALPDSTDFGGLKSSRYEKLEVSYGTIEASSYSLLDTLVFADIPATEIVNATVVAHAVSPVVLNVYSDTDMSTPLTLGGVTTPVKLSYVIKYVRGTGAVNTQDVLLQIVVGDVAGLTTEQIRDLTTKQISEMTTSQVASITTAQIPAIETRDIAAFTSSQIAALTTDQVVALTTAQVPAIEVQDIPALNTKQIRALETRDVAVLTSGELAAMSTKQLAAFTTTQTAVLSTTQTAALTTTQLAALQH